jgi:uncharacterized protein YqcC (DUF446 family)
MNKLQWILLPKRAKIIHLEMEIETNREILDQSNIPYAVNKRVNRDTNKMIKKLKRLRGDKNKN